MRGLKVIIAGAGMSAALPGVAAAHTDLPVIGVPILGKSLGGLDALLSAVQMPPGHPGRLRRDRRGEERRRARGADNQRVIPRYTRPEIGAVWTPQRKMECWLEVELAATEAWAEEGVVPAEAAEAARANAAFTVEAVDEREQVTDHDVAAFVDVVAESVGEHGRWIHYGLTSSDVLDTALALQLRQAGEVVLAERPRLPRRADRAGAGAPRHALRRPHPRRPRRADHLRPAPRRLRLRGRPQPRAARATPSSSSPSASSPARSAPTPRCRPRSRRG